MDRGVSSGELFISEMDGTGYPMRGVCSAGSKCRDRSEIHLRLVAHPFDGDYTDVCAYHRATPEEMSLRALFAWADADGSGKVSPAELEAVVPLLSALLGEQLVLTKKAWELLDEDGNGAVNFSEFAEWAGPRLGLPLGVKHLFGEDSAHARRSFGGGELPACGVLGCPCPEFRSRQRARQSRFVAHWDVFGAPGSTRSDARLELCVCGHKHSAHAEKLPACGEVPYPAYWKCTGGTAGEFLDLVPVDAESFSLFQRLFDQTYRNIWTRDRKKHNTGNPNVPKGFQVVRAARCENSKIWREYAVRRAELMQDCAESKDGHIPEFRDVKSTMAWISGGGKYADRLAPECNEWYIFHGTQEASAMAICRNDFKMSMAGGNTGTLYGRGTYFAESITKADEYAKPNAQGEYAVLLCRALGGRVRYTDQLEPDREDLVRSCIEGPFDSVLGDREKCRNTYREFVFFDSENLYAEFLVLYRRIY